jgi:hypothetical protein
MAKACVVLLADTHANALTSAKEFVIAGDEAVVVFDSAGAKGVAIRACTRSSRTGTRTPRSDANECPVVDLPGDRTMHGLPRASREPSGAE